MKIRLAVIQEQALDRLFATQEADVTSLRTVVGDIGRLQGELRLVHLQAHLDMKRILSDEQVDAYNALCGYSIGHQTTTPQTPQHRPHSH